MITGERQAVRIRNLHLKAILRQDIGYFDKEAKTGEIMDRMTNDTILIQNAIGEKVILEVLNSLLMHRYFNFVSYRWKNLQVGKFLQLSASFFGGFVIAFTKGWILALVLLSVIPVLVISAALMSVLMSKLTSRGQSAYSAAAVVAEQIISSIRTVRKTHDTYITFPCLRFEMLFLH